MHISASVRANNNQPYVDTRQQVTILNTYYMTLLLLLLPKAGTLHSTGTLYLLQGDSREPSASKLHRRQPLLGKARCKVDACGDGHRLAA